MQKNGLSQCCRLHFRKDFKFIFASGNRLQHNGIALWWMKNYLSDNSVRFAIVVSRKLGPAVIRNRAKRLLREAFRLNRSKLLPGTVVIVSPRDEKKLSSVQAAQETLMTLCGKAALLNSSSVNV